MKAIFLSIGLLLVVPTHAAEQSSPLDKIYDRCVEKHGTINNGVVDACSSEASATAKKQINLYYNKIYGRLLKDAPEDARKLEQSQKACVVYRDNHCQLMGSYVGSPMYSFCPMRLNIARADELQELAQ